jgi:arylsulfatase A-like enzyme
MFCLLAALWPVFVFADEPARPTSRPPAAPPHPNIVLIVADDLGYGDLGCYGQKQIQTPNLDRLAAMGTRFTSFYAGSTVCAPSRCVLMTGRHTGHATIRGNVAGAALTAQDLTLPLLLQGSYKTGLMGKWGLGDEGSTGLPGDKGFDEFVGYLNQKRAHDYYAPYVDRYDAKEGLRRVEFPANENGSKGAYLPDLFLKAANNFIRIHRPDWANGQQPFFVLLATTLPHANNELGAATGNGMEVPDVAPYEDRDWPQPEKNKAAMITRLDRQVGELLERLKLSKQETNTLILFTSDNGPHSEGGVKAEFHQSAGPLRGIKRDLYEGGIRVPLIAVWPGHIPAARISDEPWAFWDLLPTLAEVAGQKVPRDIDGISYLPTLLGGAQTNRHEFFYWEFYERGFQQAVRMGNWKAVRPKLGAPLELYNLASDLGETTNVAADHPDIIARIEDYLKSARTDSPRYPLEPAKPAKAAVKTSP